MKKVNVAGICMKQHMKYNKTTADFEIPVTPVTLNRKLDLQNLFFEVLNLKNWSIWHRRHCCGLVVILCCY